MGLARSQNGWPVVGRDQLDEAPLLRDVRVPNGVLAGDVAVVFRWLARQYDVRVERLKAGSCWGWLVKEIKGSQVASNHGSATAVDFNAGDNPMGSGTTRRSLTEAQIAECHAIEDESCGVLRWGSDFSRNDPMHWEIVGTPDQVAAFARRIEEDEMGSAWSEDVIPNPAWRPDARTNPRVEAGVALAQAWDLAHSAAVQGERANQALAKQATQIQQLTAKVDQLLAQLAQQNPR